jgi:hypothetical protein
MATPSAEELREKLAAVSIAGSAGSAAKRTLKALCKQDPGIGETEANVKLIAALKGCAVGNLNLESFKNFKSMIEIRESVEQKIFIIDKAVRPDLDKTAGFVGYGDESWLHHPDTVDTSVSKERFWFIDMNCSRLPKGALTIRASISTVRQSEPGTSTPALTLSRPGAAALPEAPTPQEQVAPQQLAAEANGKLRQLQKVDSETMTDEEFQLSLIETAKAKFEAQCYFDEDPNQVTVHSLLRRFKVYIKSCVQKQEEGQQDIESIPVPMQEFFKFMLKSLIMKPSYGWIAPMAEELDETLQCCAELSKGTGQALIAVQKSQLDAPGEVDLSFLDFKQDTFFRSTEYYKSYLAARVKSLAAQRAGRIAVLRNATHMAAKDRASAVDTFLKGALSEDEERELLVVRTMLSSIADKDKCKYLLSTEGNIDKMATWFPADPKVDLRLFVQGVKYKEVKFDDVFRGAEFIAGMGEVIANEVPNPIVRGILSFYVKARDLPSPHKASDSTLRSMASKLLQELAFVKLGMALPVDHAAPAVPQNGRDFAAGMFKLVESIWRRNITSTQQQQCHWMRAVQQCAEETSAKGSQDDTSQPGKEKAPIVPAPASVLATASQVPPSVPPGSAAPAVSAPALSPEITVGQQVKIRLPSNKDIHSYEAEVKGVCAKTYQIVMTQGPKKGLNTKIDKDKVSLVKTPAQDHPEEPAAKAARLEALATAVQTFGDLGDM